MLATVRSLRLARLFAVLAVILMAGLGQHVHAFEADRSVAVLAADTSSSGGNGGQAIPPDAHCAACHLVQATMLEAVGVRAPAILTIGVVRPGGDLQPDLAVPDGPARPPRRARAV